MPWWHYAVVTCETKLFWNMFEIISLFYFTYVTTDGGYMWNKTLKLFQFFKIISAAEIISKLFQRHWTCWKIFRSCNKPLKWFWNNFTSRRYRRQERTVDGKCALCMRGKSAETKDSRLKPCAAEDRVRCSERAWNHWWGDALVPPRHNEVEIQTCWDRALWRQYKHRLHTDDLLNTWTL